jgi:hypothetical protein
MRRVDMSADAVTSRLKLASELRRLCLKLATAKIRPRKAQITKSSRGSERNGRKKTG